MKVYQKQLSAQKVQCGEVNLPWYINYRSTYTNVVVRLSSEMMNLQNDDKLIACVRTGCDVVWPAFHHYHPIFAINYLDLLLFSAIVCHQQNCLSYVFDKNRILRRTTKIGVCVQFDVHYLVSIPA